MTEKSEKCFVPVVINNLKLPFILGVMIIFAGLALTGIVLVGEYLSDYSESTGAGIAFNNACNALAIQLVQNSLLVFIVLFAIFVLWAALAVKEGNKQSGYLILVLCVLPMTVCYFAIRSLFWLHILILTNNTLYEPIPGLAFLIIIVGIIVLWAVCGALAEGVTTCYKNEAK